MAKIYVASSWRNPRQADIVRVLRTSIQNHEVYDFKNPAKGNKGFHWSKIDSNWKTWSKREYRDYLQHSIAQEGFDTDFKAMEWADTFVGVMPFGKSASFEMGWAAGCNKRTILLLEDGEPELMVKMFDDICCNIGELLEALVL